MDITEGLEVEFFSEYYHKAFQTPTEQIEITTCLMRFISESFLGETLTNLGITAKWLELATQLPEFDTECQLVAFSKDFI